MITEDEVMRLFARADPARVEDVAPVLGATGYLDSLRTRSTRLTLIDTIQTTPTEPVNPRRWPKITAAAAALIVIAVGALVFAARGDDAEPVIPVAPATTAAEDVANPSEEAAAAAKQVAVGFLEASASFDVDGAASYLSDNALASLGGLEQMRLQAAWEQATGFTKSTGTCEPQGSSPSGITVDCPYDFQGIRSAEMGLGPFSGSYDQFKILDGKIVGVGGPIIYEENGFSTQVWEPFALWVSETYPDDAAIMYTDSSFADYRLTDQSIQLWEQHSLEYAAM